MHVVEFVDAVRARRMVRHFDASRPVARDVVEMLLKQAIRAPSAGHTQGRHFLVLDDITTRQLFWSTTSSGAPDAWRSGMAAAPVLILVFVEREAYLDRYAEPDKGWSDRDLARWPVPFWHVDAGMASMTLLLGATDAGLGACFFGVPGERQAALCAAFHVPEGRTPVGVIALGHAADGARSRPLKRRRRPFAEVVTFAADATATSATEATEAPADHRDHSG